MSAVGHFEHSFKLRFFFTVADEFTGSSAAGQKLDSIDDDRFSRSRLPSQDSQSIVEADGQVTDNREVLD